MKLPDLIDLLILAALWGASFLFMRIAAPAFGPIALVELRVSIAALALLALLLWRKQLIELHRHLRLSMWIGLTNSALPFVLLSYATLHVTAGFAAILNATTPWWTALIASLWLRDRVRPVQWLGLVVGLLGVLVLVWGKVDLRPGASQWSTTLAVGAALIATCAYGFSANLIKRRAAAVPPLVLATGSLIGASLALLPLTLLHWPAQLPSPLAWSCALVLGLACTALAYLLYFRLLGRVGPLRAAAVTFLIPVFATVWGAVFLQERLTLQMLAGGAIVLLGTGLSLGLVGKARAAA